MKIKIENIPTPLSYQSFNFIGVQKAVSSYKMIELSETVIFKATRKLEYFK